MARGLPLRLLGFLSLFVCAASSQTQQTRKFALERDIPSQKSAQRHWPGETEQSNRRLVKISTGGEYKDGSWSLSECDSYGTEAVGDKEWAWIKVPNKRVDPACDEDEHVLDLGTMETQEECLAAAKQHGHLGNAAIWERSLLDGNCHLCNLRKRAKALHLDYADSPHHDSFIQVEGMFEMYSNDGNAHMKTPGRWLVDCRDLEDDTKYITVTYGAKTDYFKPIADDGATFCSMLQTNDQHLWSPTGADDSWTQPDYEADDDWEVCGGSAVGWPSAHAGDDRQTLHSWCTRHTGQGDPEGGYGSESGDASWGHAFTIGYFREYAPCDGSFPHHAYPCQCGNTVCHEGKKCTEDQSFCSVPEAAGDLAPTSGGNTSEIDGTTTTVGGTTTTVPGGGTESGSAASDEAGGGDTQNFARHQAGGVLTPIVLALISYAGC